MGRELRRSSRKEVAESSKARARMKVKARRERRPNWLPEGWSMQVGEGENGETVKYYTSVSGRTFHSRQEVLQYLKITKFDGHASKTTSFSENKKEMVVAEVRNSPEWLPRGWILEIKTRLSGNSVGKKYKCYFDPFSGSRFYSKAEVLHFLKSGNTYSPTSGQKRPFKASTTDNVLAQIEYSPDGLPYGWIKETLFRQSNNRVARRRDPYYTDPVTGYVFRSLKDATRFVETGELSKYAFGPRKRSINEMYSLEKESPPPIPYRDLKSLGSTVRRNLFSEDASTSTGDRVTQINELPDKLQLSPPHPALSESFQEVDPTSYPDIEHTEGKFNKKRRQVMEATTDKSLNAPNHRRKRPKRERSPVKAQTPAMESADMVIAIDELPDKLQLPPPDHESSIGLQKAVLISSPDIEHIEGKADKKRSGLEATTDDSLNASKHVEKKAKRGRPPKRSGPNKEKKDSKKLLEPKMVTGKPSETTTKITPVPQGRKQQRSKDKSASLPRRLSKRLAGLEPVPATYLVICHPSCQAPPNGGCSGFEASAPPAEPERTDNAEKLPVSNGRCNGTEESVCLTEPEKTDHPEENHPLGESNSAEPEKMNSTEKQLLLGEPLSEPERTGSAVESSLREPLAKSEWLDNEGEASLGERVLLTGQTSEDGPTSPFALPFGDAWSDPCIEFAVKTLMGEIPVLDEGLAIEEYVQKQLSSAESSDPSASASAIASANQGLDQSKLLGPVEPPKEKHLPVDDGGKPCPFEKGLPPRAKAPKVKG